MLPDVLPVARAFLLADGAVAALVGSRIYGRTLPANPDRDVPLVVLTPIAESSVTNTASDHTLDCGLQVDVWGRYPQDAAHARKVAATIHNALRTGLPGYVHTNGHVSAVLPDIGIQPLPDDELARARAMFQVRVIAYPAAA
jgi:hypothetical protein